MFLKIVFLNVFLHLAAASYYDLFSKLNYLDLFSNRTRPSKSFSNYNLFPSGSKSNKVQCGTRSVNFNPTRKAKIVGGSEIPYGAFPWQVEVQMLDPDKLSFEHHCGGAVIGEKLVVSAAHCFDRQPLQLEQLRVVTGEHRLKVQDQYETRFLVEKLILHPEFRKNGRHSNDIALVGIRGRGSLGIQFNSHVRPICLPEKTSEAGQWCTVSGWGYEDESTESFAPVLRAAAVPVLDLATCRKSQVLGGRQQAILDSMLCAGVLGGGVDACSGDSGGPLACAPPAGRWQLLGVVSWGAGCARRARPGVYTRVSSYVGWIRSAAGKNGYSIS
ncbi:hypothetical protein JYU34_021979 [Plutella xylostella]|uniref:Peptidase S1 domain-containing protein n=1 Tax=Plutella xylostella TaxID=51655 RepID=A0ABQ7PRS9_PLUXY|nr:trypsin [Plutella xylostella]KAG7295693.1 hypothetical protein JYU34_021979 [Plutella xylostella]